MSIPLEGIRVVEVNAGIPIAITGVLLRDSGAEVIKLEPPGGDPSRQPAGHRSWNRGKKSVVLDRSDRRYAQLLGSADVILVGGSRSKLDGYQASDDQVVAFAPPYADAEPYSNLPEDDELASALAGVIAGTAAYREGPAFPVLQTISLAAGGTLSDAVAAALLVRQRTGRGQEVRVPWSTIGAYIAGYQASQSDKIPRMPAMGGPSPLGLSLGWRVFRAKDGWVGIACANPVFFNRLIACLDQAELLSDPRFAMAPYVAPENQAALEEVLTKAFAERTQAEWTKRFEEFSVPGSVVLNRDRFAESDLVIDNKMMAMADDPEVGKVRQVAMPVVLEGSEVPGPAPAPTLGADTDAVLATVSDERPRPEATDATLPAHPLAGTRVLDFTGFLAGPTAGRLLVELGAEVIKVEPPDGEGFRMGGLSCVGINAGKKSVAINSRTPEGRAVVERLIKSADVLLQALIPGSPEKIGLDYETVKSINPKIVYCWISGFGAAKTWHGRPSFDLLMQALSGQMFTLGSEEDEQPVYSSMPMADLFAGMMAVYGITVSLAQRDRDGLGRAVSTNQVAASMAAQTGQIVKFDGSPKLDVNATSLGRSAVNRLYETSDGWAITAARDANGWKKIVDALGGSLGGWASWEKASAEPVDGELASALGAVIGGMSRADIKSQLIAKGAPCAPVVAVRNDQIDNEFFMDLGTTVSGIEHEKFGSLTTIANFFRFSETPAKVPDMAQWVGEQNREVLRTVDYSDAEIDALLEAGTIAEPELRMMGS
ncbi:MAG TPA: CoA transferase [Dehalococcoidia bacterium]|nr:CoA transferase [Dehalococcoidia bacterium]